MTLEAWDRSARRRFTPCGDGKMIWRLWGEGPCLVLVHGGAGSWSHWIRNLPEWTRHRTVVAPDLPGLGESASPPRPYTPESIAAITASGLREVLEALGAASTDVCGFSFGGMISGLVAEALKERVGRLLLIGASGLGGAIGQRPVYKRPAGASAEELDRIHRRNLESMMIHDPARIDDLALAVQRMNAPRTRILSPEHALSHKLEDALRRSGLPFDTLWGEHCIFAPDLARRREVLAAIDPRAGFHVIPGAGHWAQFEAAEVLNPLVLRLLREAVGRGNQTTKA